MSTILSLLLFLVPFSLVVQQTWSKILYIDRFDHLKKLAESDLKIVQYFVQFRKDAENSKSIDPSSETGDTPATQIPPEIDEYIKDFKRGNGEISHLENLSTNEIETLTENISKDPISSYRLLVRYSVDLPKILHSTEAEILEQVGKLIVTGKFKWPSSKELKLAASAILRVQQMYNISCEQFSRGSLPGIELNGKLDLKHIYDLGLRALKSGFYALAIEWFEFGLQKIQNDDGRGADKFMKLLKDAKNSHDKEYEKGEEWNPWLFDRPLLQDGLENESKITKRLKRGEKMFRKFKGNLNGSYDNINTRGVCIGENYQTLVEKSRLFCWYEFTVHSRHQIAPLKIEFLSRQPDVYMIYNFVVNSLTHKIHNGAAADEKLKVKGRRKNTAPSSIDGKGLGVANFIWDGLGNTHDLLPLSKNVEDATGMRTVGEEDSDNLYVKSYTWATQSSLHTDATFLANAMHYLNDVDVGGFTAFPRLGFAVKPVKGALLVWYNRLRDQETDQLLKHISCPLIFGRKQIATKWIFANPQFHKFPCDLSPGGRYKTRVNGRLDY